MLCAGGVQNCHRAFSAQMAAQRANRRSTEALKRGCRSPVGNRTCDRVRRSKPLFANVSKGHRCFPTRVAAGSSSAISRNNPLQREELFTPEFWPPPCFLSHNSSVPAVTFEPPSSKTIRSHQGKRFLTRQAIEFK